MTANSPWDGANVSWQYVDDPLFQKYTVENHRNRRHTMNNVLLTDRVFLSLSVPLQPEQEKELEESLLQDGCRDPIITWNGVIIDGHKRYHFCLAEGIEYFTEEMDFPTKEEAVSWVCRKHIPNYGKKSVPYRYLVGRLYKAQKKIYRDIRKQPEDMRVIQLNPDWDRVSYYVAEELKLNHATIESHGAYAAAMEQIVDAYSVIPGINSQLYIAHCSSSASFRTSTPCS